MSLSSAASSRDDRIAVAMSGGVDSSVAALLLHRQGRSLVGISLQLHDRAEGGGDTFGGCCSPRDFLDARQVAGQVGFPFYVLNMEEQFRRTVLQNFETEYLSGRTPVPCARCNSEVKFGDLMRRARSLGCERIATGHYARTRRDEVTGRTRLFRARDREKDQSYFLFGLTQEQLEHSLFPVGDFTKTEVRDLAEQAGLRVARKPESMDLCFLSQGGYRGFLEARLGERAPAAGDFVDRDGRVLGRHGGIHLFTVGQRRGLGIPGGQAWYVLELRPEERQVVLGREDEQFRSFCTVPQPNWTLSEVPRETFRAVVQIRHRHQGCDARIASSLDGGVTIEFSEPQRAITPGQAAVFYQGDEVLGGGFIASAH